MPTLPGRFLPSGDIGSRLEGGGGPHGDDVVAIRGGHRQHVVAVDEVVLDGRGGVDRHDRGLPAPDPRDARRARALAKRMLQQADIDLPFPLPEW